MVSYQPPRLGGVLTLLLLVACDQSPEPVESAPAPSVVVPALTLNNWSQGRYAAVRDSARKLQETVDTFVGNPSAETRGLLQDSWRDAHDRYLEINLVTGASTLDDRIDAWPMEPGFLDSLPDYPSSGIINDETLTIDTATVIEQHQITDASEVALGFHTIEYYAYERPLADFMPGADNAERRRQLLTLVSTQLVDDITQATADIEKIMSALDYPRLLDALILVGQRLIRECDEWQEHSPFSSDSNRNLHQQLKLVQALLSDQTGLTHYIVDLDGEKAMALIKTLEQLTTLTESAGSTQGNIDQIRLLLTGFVHQLEDVSAVADDAILAR